MSDHLPLVGDLSGTTHPEPRKRRGEVAESFQHIVELDGHEDGYDSIAGVRGVGRGARLHGRDEGRRSSRAGRRGRAAGPASRRGGPDDRDGGRSARLLFGRSDQERVAGAGRCGGDHDQGRVDRVREEAEHRCHHGRRCRHLEHRCLSPGNDGRPDAEPRPAGLPGDAVHRLLRRGELHGRPRQLHHRPAPHPHRHDHRGPGGCLDRPAGPGARRSPRR